MTPTPSLPLAGACGVRRAAHHPAGEGCAAVCGSAGPRRPRQPGGVGGLDGVKVQGGGGTAERGTGDMGGIKVWQGQQRLSQPHASFPLPPCLSALLPTPLTPSTQVAVHRALPAHPERPAPGRLPGGDDALPLRPQDDGPSCLRPLRLRPFSSRWGWWRPAEEEPGAASEWRGGGGSSSNGGSGGWDRCSFVVPRWWWRFGRVDAAAGARCGRGHAQRWRGKLCIRG